MSVCPIRRRTSAAFGAGLQVLWLLAAACGIAASPGGASIWGIDEQVAADLRAERWPAVLADLSHVTVDDSSGVARYLKAHACLAVDRNNESYCLFSSLTPADLASCREWVGELISESPAEAPPAGISYLLGDIQARVG
ncbi:MAG: hypothetical protein GF355_16460, partial [Candidatus Eisenbacteria bacterium]|nr:hypothetical protein [Candidatus Eisenbacteria bacterium]